MSFNEVGTIIENIKIELDIFEGDEGDPNRRLLERKTIENGALIKHEWFDSDGNVTKTEGGNN